MNFKLYFEDINADFYINDELKNHSNFKIGGICPLIIVPKDNENLLKTLKIIKQNKMKYFILGSGANVLFMDEGYNGVIVKCSDKYATYSVNKNIITATAGISIIRLCNIALNNSLTGFEFAFGIPGTLGGAVFMNAGAYDGEMSDIVLEVEYIDENNNLVILDKRDLEFSYRNSFFSDKNYCITKVKLILEYGNKFDIKSKMDYLISKRLSKQPYFLPSVGSTFKRPEGSYASYLIEKAGLKGKSFGNASVSSLHSGFIVNNGGATSSDILNLIEIVKKEVFKKTGYILECEVKIVK